MPGVGGRTVRILSVPMNWLFPSISHTPGSYSGWLVTPPGGMFTLSLLRCRPQSFQDEPYLTEN